MRSIGALILGILCGVFGVLAVLRCLPDSRDAQSEDSVVLLLTADLDRTRSEVRRLQAELEIARATPARGFQGDELSAGEAGTGLQEPPQSLEERGAAARSTLEELGRLPELLELRERFSNDDSDFPSWSPSDFIEDPLVNPLGLVLGDEERKRFDQLFARACQRTRVLALERELTLAKSLLAELDEQLESGAPSFSSVGAARVAPTASLLADRSLVIDEASFPEAGVLADELRVAILEWLSEAREFFNELR